MVSGAVLGDGEELRLDDGLGDRLGDSEIEDDGVGDTLGETDGETDGDTDELLPPAAAATRTPTKTHSVTGEPQLQVIAPVPRW